MNTQLVCPHCKNDDENMMERLQSSKFEVARGITNYICGVCSKLFRIQKEN